MLKKLGSFYLLLAALALVLSACDKPKSKSGGMPGQPNTDELTGYWQNTTTLSARERKSGVIMRLHFYRENGILAVEWCSSNGASGVSNYKVQGKHLTISGTLDKSDTANASLNLNAEITSKKPDQLILNGTSVYQRFTPTETGRQICLR